jgi:hypothetical protein
MQSVMSQLRQRAGTEHVLAPVMASHLLNGRAIQTPLNTYFISDSPCKIH